VKNRPESEAKFSRRKACLMHGKYRTFSEHILLYHKENKKASPFLNFIEYSQFSPNFHLLLYFFEKNPL